MNITRWEPFREFEDMFRQYSPLFSRALRMAGIRRVPVVDTRGTLIGVFALDDAIDLVTGLLCDITGSIKSEQRQEWRAKAG